MATAGPMIPDQPNIHILFDLLNFTVLMDHWWPPIRAEIIYLGISAVSDLFIAVSGSTSLRMTVFSYSC